MRTSTIVVGAALAAGVALLLRRRPPPPGPTCAADVTQASVRAWFELAKTMSATKFTSELAGVFVRTPPSCQGVVVLELSRLGVGGPAISAARTSAAAILRAAGW